MNENCIVDIENLRVHFPLNKELVKAVEGVSFSINLGETLAVVGESGSGKSVTAMSTLRLNDMAGAEMPTGSIKLRLKNNEVVDMFETSEKDLVNIRGNHVSMIFQEPMTCLNPVLTVGLQISEAIMIHQGLNEEKARDKTLEMLNLVRIPDLIFSLLKRIIKLFKIIIWQIPNHSNINFFKRYFIFNSKNFIMFKFFF